jgi:hypothetical protein
MEKYRVAKCYIFIPKSQFGYILEGLGMENDDIHILWPFGIYYGHLVYFMTFWAFCIFSPHFGILHQEKSGNPENNLGYDGIDV